MSGSGWVAKGTGAVAGRYLRESPEGGFLLSPGLLGAYAFTDKGEASTYIERTGFPGRVMANPLHRCHCGAVSRETTCEACR